MTVSDSGSTPMIFGGDGMGFGNGGFIWAFLIFALLMGNGGFGGWGNGNGNSNAIQNDINRGFDNQNLQSQTRDILAAVTSGTAQSVAATNQTFHDTLAALNDKYSEIARDIAIRFNKKYGETFKVPEPLIRAEGTKIMDLQSPDKKMSKSSENQKGVIRLLDDPAVIRKKIMSATTDSVGKINFDPENQPGISNLINIYVSLSGMKQEEVVTKFADSNYGTFKTAVADLVVEEIEKIQKRYNDLINSEKLDRILDEGVEKTKQIAKEKYELMKQKIGLRR